MKKYVVVAAKSYTVDFTARKIIATAEFMANAGQYGSEEYNTVMNLRKDLPDFTIEVQEEKKEKKAFEKIEIVTFFFLLFVIIFISTL